MMKKRFLSIFCIFVPICFLFLSPIQATPQYDIKKTNFFETTNQNTESKIETNLKRCEFTSMLVETFNWKKVNSITPTFSDNIDKSKWYYPDIETAAIHGIRSVKDNFFYPEKAITKEEIAVMLIQALGYDSLANSIETIEIPFADVTENKGYILMAYDFGILTGASPNMFEPKSTISKEDAITILSTAYEKYHSKLDFLHGFYAFSSWGQKEIASQMDSISVGWSKLEYSKDTGVVLNTGSKNDNEWKIPLGFEDAVKYFEGYAVPIHLNVYLSATQTQTAKDGATINVCKEILTKEENRSIAIKAIAAELTKSYEQTGKPIYSGITIDFENMKTTQLKDSFTEFLKQLKQAIGTDKNLYVAVHPKLKNSSSYYDAYDYYNIGLIADKIILMAHDYQATKLNQETMDSGFVITPMTPFDEIYFALHSITDKNTGVQDKNKLVLAISMNTCGWTKKGGVIQNSQSLTPSYQAIHNLIQSGASVTYSEDYRNPYIKYTENAEETIIWFENEKSIQDKIELAKMFGVNGLSVWRIGTIPQYHSSDLDIWKAIAEQRK